MEMTAEEFLTQAGYRPELQPLIASGYLRVERLHYRPSNPRAGYRMPVWLHDGKIRVEVKPLLPVAETWLELENFFQLDFTESVPKIGAAFAEEDQESFDERLTAIAMQLPVSWEFAWVDVPPASLTWAELDPQSAVHTLALIDVLLSKVDVRAVVNFGRVERVRAANLVSLPNWRLVDIQIGAPVGLGARLLATFLVSDNAIVVPNGSSREIVEATECAIDLSDAAVALEFLHLYCGLQGSEDNQRFRIVERAADLPIESSKATPELASELQSFIRPVRRRFHEERGGTVPVHAFETTLVVGEKLQIMRFRVNRHGIVLAIDDEELSKCDIPLTKRRYDGPLRMTAGSEDVFQGPGTKE